MLKICESEEIIMNTKEFMRKIYDDVSSNEPDVQAVEKAIGEEIQSMTKEHRDRFSNDDLNLICDMLFSVQTMSMREGYILGAKHSAALMAEVKRQL